MLEYERARGFIYTQIIKFSSSAIRGVHVALNAFESNRGCFTSSLTAHQSHCHYENNIENGRVRSQTYGREVFRHVRNPYWLGSQVFGYEGPTYPISVNNRTMIRLGGYGLIPPGKDHAGEITQACI